MIDHSADRPGLEQRQTRLKDHAQRNPNEEGLVGFESHPELRVRGHLSPLAKVVLHVQPISNTPETFVESQPRS
jgi:hypothetical protein